mmetsp:Transcript_11205/g.41942  ORF Transcript_11205/g.41942 Transcript_11205/m.41942 type:complete len:554 (+) Transcript_11205:445-2106(+)
MTSAAVASTDMDTAHHRHATDTYFSNDVLQQEHPPTRATRSTRRTARIGEPPALPHTLKTPNDSSSSTTISDAPKTTTKKSSTSKAPTRPSTTAALKKRKATKTEKRKRFPKDDNEVGQILLNLKHDNRLKNQIVWAKIKGFPDWPGKITDIEGNKLRVWFYGEGTFSFVLPKHTKPFDVIGARAILEKHKKLIEGAESTDTKDSHTKLCESITMALEELAGNADICYNCQRTGFLICCDGCSNASHIECADLSSVPDENQLWFCSRCIASGQKQSEMAQRRQDASIALKETTGSSVGASSTAFENPFYERKDPIADIIGRSYWTMLHEGDSRNKKRKYSDDEKWKSFKKRFGKKETISMRALRLKRRRISGDAEGANEESPMHDIRLTDANIRSDIQSMQEEQPLFDASIRYFGSRPFRGQNVVRWHWEQESEDMHMFFPSFNNDDIEVMTIGSLWQYLKKEDTRIEHELCDLRYWCDLIKGWILIKPGWSFSFRHNQTLTLRMARFNKHVASETHLYRGKEYAEKVCGAIFTEMSVDSVQLSNSNDSREAS